MSHSTRTAFVLGLGENGYGIMRGLAGMGVSIFGFYDSTRSFGKHSRFCKAFQLVQNTAAGSEICNALVEKCKGLLDRPVLFPTSDAYVNLILNNRELFSKHFRYHWVSPEQHHRVIDKACMHNACVDARVRVPRTHVTQPGEDVNASASGFIFPCIVKPCRSFNTPFPSGMKNFIATSSAELCGFYALYPDTLGTTLWQEIIEGADSEIFQCTALFRQNGELGAAFCARKLRQYLPGYGIMCFGRSEENSLVLSSALRLLRKLEWRGIASLEFKKRKSDGKYYFIEMNPRLPWYSGLFVDSGVNLASLAFRDLTEGDLFDSTAGIQQQNGIHWLALTEDLGWFVRTRGNRPISTLKWMSSLTLAKSYAWWNLHDLRPGIFALLHLCWLGIRAKLR